MSNTDVYGLTVLNILLCCFTLSFSRPLNIAMMDAAPFVCRQNISPCPPALSTDANPENGCLYGGLMTKNEGCIHGYLVDLISLVSSPSKANFSFNLWHIIGSNFGGYNNVVREIFQPGYISKIKGRNFTMCGENPCDMAVGDVTQNWARSSLPNALFTTPFMSVGLQIVARLEHTSPWYSSAVFLVPFEKRLWFAIFFSLIYMSVMIFLIERGKLFQKFFLLKNTDGWEKAFRRVFISNEFVALKEYNEESTAESKEFALEFEEKNQSHSCRRRRSVLYLLKDHSKQKKVRMSYLETLWFTFLSVMLLQDPSEVVTNASRAVIWTWMSIVVVLVASYTASLTSALTSQSIVLVMKGLSTGPFAAETLATATANCKNCLVLQKTSNTGTYVASAKHVDLNNVRDESQVAPGLSGNAKYKKILTDPTVQAWIGDDITVQGATASLADSGLQAQVCEWSTVGPSFAVQSFAFPMSYLVDVSTKNAIDQILNELNSNLLLNGLQAKWFMSYPSCMNPALQSSSNTFTLQNFMGPLLVLWTISGFALGWKVSRGFYLAQAEINASKTAAEVGGSKKSFADTFAGINNQIVECKT